jgi:hypothetical protein
MGLLLIEADVAAGADGPEKAFILWKYIGLF